MSDIQDLIAALDRNTASNDALNATVAAGNEGRAAVLEAAQSASAKAKPAAAKPAAEKPAEAAKPAAAAAGEIDAATDPVGAAILGYIGDTTGEERAARKEKVKNVLGKVGAEKHSEVPEDKKANFIKAMNDLKAKGNVIVAAAVEEDDLLGDD